MTSKRLRQLTIIPKDLYVERDADRQLASIVSNMGRPGFVLVARQMGKTNLLLNAKSNLEAAGDYFIYIDASNTFPDVRSFFRNIIDVVIDTNEDFIALQTTRDSILDHRVNSARLPHKEHELELREVLRATSRKLIICIDEIDALKKCDFSDQVFAFIRSIYFSGRSNFKEFERITYILSGVAEPSEIIKNKDISPFNIGEKIYLNDFSMIETRTLLEQSQIYIDEQALTHLYHLANGHPRITWDISSKIEDLITGGETVTPAKIDQIVRSLYFSEIDTAPIDHIKDIVEANKEIRDALISIHYEKSDAIPESTKTRLYLYGITQSGLDTAPPKFKNTIIEEALSEKFLLSIPTQTSDSLLSTGISQFRSDEFQSALISFTSGINSTSDEAKISTFRYWMSLSKFKLLDYEGCLEELEGLHNSTLTAPIEILRYSNRLQCICMLRTNQAEKIFSLFRKFDFNDSDAIEIEAYIDHLEAALDLQPGRLNAKEEITRCKSVVADRSKILKQATTTRTPIEIISKAYYVLGKLLYQNSDANAANSTINDGIEFFELDLKIRALFFLSDISASQRKVLLSQCVGLVGLCKGFSRYRDPNSDSVSVDTLFGLLNRVNNFGQISSIDAILELITARDRAGLSSVNTISTLADIALEKGSTQLGASLLTKYLSQSHDHINPLDRRNIIRYILSFDSTKFSEFSTDYLNTFNETKFIDPHDLIIVSGIVLNSINTINLSLARKALDIFLFAREIDGFFDTPVEFENHLLIANYLRHMIALSSNPNQGEVFSARSFSQKIQNYKNFQLPGFPNDYTEIILPNLIRKLQRFGSTPIRNMGLRVGRNDIVTVNYSGNYVSGKYKKFEYDIKKGVCLLIGSGVLKPNEKEINGIEDNPV
jgi:hypothetical protein